MAALTDYVGQREYEGFVELPYLVVRSRPDDTERPGVDRLHRATASRHKLGDLALGNYFGPGLTHDFVANDPAGVWVVPFCW